MKWPEIGSLPSEPLTMEKLRGMPMGTVTAYRDFYGDEDIAAIPVRVLCRYDDSAEWRVGYITREADGRMRCCNHRMGDTHLFAFKVTDAKCHCIRLPGHEYPATIDRVSDLGNGEYEVTLADGSATAIVRYCGSGDADPDYVALWECDECSDGICAHITAVIRQIEIED